MKRTAFGHNDPVPILEIPEVVTASFRRFHVEHQRLLDFFVGLASMAMSADHAAQLAPSSDKPVPGEPARVPRGEPAASTGLAFLQTNHRLMNKLIFGRGVDNLLTYVSDILNEVFLYRSETLHASQQKIPVSTILRYKTREDLIAFIAESQVQDLSYRGVAELSEHLSRTLSLSLLEIDTDLQELVRIVEDRNLLVHNRGVVNGRYLAKVPSAPYAVGNSLLFLTRETLNDFVFLHDVGMDLDARIIAKFNLPEAGIR